MNLPADNPLSQPNAFLPQPGHGYPIAPTPAEAWQPSRTQRSSSRFPPISAAMLTIRPAPHQAGRAPRELVTLTKEMLVAVPHLKGGAPVDLVVPARRGGQWLLNTRAQAPRRVENGKPRFTIPALSREHYLQGGCRGRLKEGVSGVRQFLTFSLGPEIMEEVCVQDAYGQRVCQQRGTGYFELLPVA